VIPHYFKQTSIIYLISAGPAACGSRSTSGRR
jgi:hypothetical protein